ncbi:hypothetical protein BKA63DRAFT_569412 [Paraphoma chrysanthemicola]|nr:hypothetical protein BKA63DRAFT_569412 [Paraphoma chrysanthemicola]
MSEHRPYSPDLEEIIDRYASPALDSSSPMKSMQSFDTSPRHGDGDDTLRSPPSSPPASCAETSHQRHNLTSSGYLSRSELLKHAPPSEASSSSPFASRALDRFERRSRASLSTSSGELGTSPLLPYGQSIENPGAQSLNYRRPVQSSMTSSTPSLHSSSSFGRESTSSLRTKLPGAFPDEWTEAGSLSVQLQDTALRADPTLNSDHIKDADEHADTLSKSSSLSLQSELHRLSPAEMALRETLINTTRPPQQIRQTSWASRLFSRRKASSTGRTMYQSAISDDNTSEFECVEPETASESPEAANNRARGKEQESENNTLAQSFHAESTMAGNDKMSTTAREEDAMSLSADVGSIMPPGSLSHSVSEYGTSSSSLPLASYPSTASLSDNGDGNPSDLRSNSIAGSEETTAHSLPRMSLAPIVVINNQEPKFMMHQDNLGLAPPVAVFEQAPRHPNHNLALSPVQAVFADTPIAVMPSRGLGFVTANAIIYGFITVVTLRFIVANLGADVRTSDLASDIGFAIFAALIVCAALHHGLGGSLEKIWKDTSYSVGDVVDEIKWKLVNALGMAEGKQE